MSKLLYLQASPRVERSHSRAVAGALVEAYAETHPGNEIETLDLFTLDLPAFDGPAVQAKYTILHGETHSAEEAATWKAIERVIAQFTSADLYVIAVPMWNFGIPYRLKQYLDVIIQPGLTFSFSPETGYQGLVTGKKAVVVYARGGAYSEGDMAAYDFQKPYLQTALGFIGITDVEAIVVEPTLAAGAEGAQQVREAGMARARERGASL